MAYSDEDLKRQISGFEGKTGERDRVNAIDAYLGQLSPSQLLERYRFLQTQNPKDISDYSNKNYGVTTARDKAYYSAYKTAQDVLGRDLTGEEFAQIAPLFGNGSPEEITSGRAYLAQMAQQEAQNPLSKKNQGKAGQYSGDINGIFQELLKRGASQDEINHFGSLLSTGQTDPYELRQFVQQLPEYQTAQDTQFRQGLDTELQNSDAAAFKKEAGNVISDYGNRGIYNSPSLDYALTDLMGKMAENRQSFLTSLSAQQYQGNKANATADYNTTRNNFFANQDYNKQRSNQVEDMYTQRSFGVNDYNREMNDYLGYLNQHPKYKPTVFDYLNTGANVARGVGSLVSAGRGG